MKKIFCLMLMLVFLSLGCANQQAYTAYTNAITQANAYRKAPGLVQEFDSQGKLVKQAINFPDEGVKVAQIKDSEWVGTISQVLSLATIGGTSVLLMDKFAGITKSMRSTTYDSHNTAGANMAGGDVTTTSVPTTTTTTNMTTTTTNPAAEK